MITRRAKINSSGRIVEIEIIGRVMYVIHTGGSVSGPFQINDKRFTILPEKK